MKPEREPRVTVIMAVHNGERYVDDALHSLFAQTFDDCELLVVDDASSDLTPKIIVAASERAASLGDRAWRELLERHHELVRCQLVRFRGREVDTAGDGFFASFDGPARAIRCAYAISEGVRELGLDLRAGLHTGECELVDGKVAGIAVHTGARGLLRTAGRGAPAPSRTSSPGPASRSRIATCTSSRASRASGALRCGALRTSRAEVCCFVALPTNCDTACGDEHLPARA